MWGIKTQALGHSLYWPWQSDQSSFISILVFSSWSSVNDARQCRVFITLNITALISLSFLSVKHSALKSFTFKTALGLLFWKTDCCKELKLSAKKPVLLLTGSKHIPGASRRANTSPRRVKTYTERLQDMKKSKRVYGTPIVPRQTSSKQGEDRDCV